MNYIKHLNSFFSFVKNDQRLTASHVSLYMALFHYWNFNRFHNPFSIYRENIMQLSKIGSKNTYHKCIKELHEAKYIFYHPAPSKFQVVRISIVRLDTEEEQPSRYKQLDLFSTGFDTGNVPILRPHGTDFNTVPVSKMGHLIKQTNKQREALPQKNFDKNKKIQENLNNLAAGGHFPSPFGEGGRRPDEAMQGASVPNLGHMADVMQSTVEAHFQQLNYPNEEAIKFYNHYKSLGWKIQGKTPIKDWKPLVEKWMTNAKKWDAPPSRGGGSESRGRSTEVDASTEVQFLFESFLEGKRISHYIKAAHFEELKLQLTDEIMQQAWKERINQVAGTNQHSLSQLWQAYLTNKPNNELVQKDNPNLLELAKRIAVFKHFQQCKQRNIQQLPLPP